MQNKKILSTLIVTMLTLSMIIAFIPMASAAISAPTLAPDYGPVGTKVKVSGTGATAGLKVEVYWDAVVAWDGEKGYLNETTALGDGSYELYVTIPEANQSALDHYIIAFDVTSETSLGTAFAVTPEITLTPEAGLPGDSVSVSGTGFAGTSDVDVYFANSTTGESVTLSGYTNNTATVSNITGTLTDYPVIPISVNITLSCNYTGQASFVNFNVHDNGTGGLYGNYTTDVNATGTIDYSTGFFNITLDSPGGLYVGSPATATYLRSLTTAYPADTATTSSLGSFTASFTVPDVTNENYTVQAIDASQNHANATFKVGPNITLTPDEGPTGAVIDVAGRGFTPYGVIASVTIDATAVPLIENNTIDSTGNFTGQLVIPTVAVGAYNITVEDNATLKATLPFTVTGTTKITLSPVSGVPGNTITIEGENFTAIAATQVTVNFNTTPTPTPVGPYNTNSTGGFSGTFNVPAIPWPNTYTVNATDANGLTANTTFVIGLVYATLSKTEGPTGSNVTATGTGFTANKAVNGTLDDKLLFTGTVGSDGAFSESFIVPTVSVGTYTVIIMDTAGVTFNASFTVTKTTELILTPSSAPTTYNVTVEANYFTATNATTITFIIKNTTWSYDFTGNFTPTPKTNATGSFKGSFIVNTTWAIGSYTINATDANYLTVEITFTVAAVYIDAYTRTSEYLQGDTVSFYIKCDLNPALTIEIKDLNNYPYGSISIAAANWATFDAFKVVPYDKTVFALPSDATLGAWSWNITSGGETLKTGTFNVVEKPTLSMILDRLDELEVTITGLVTTTEGNLALLIETEIGTVLASLDDVNATITGLITDAEGNVKAYIDTSLGPVIADLDDIHAKVVDIDWETKIATIQTDVGVVKADVSDIVEKGVTVDLTPVWIAVVLSLIAAIAACYAVATIHRKLA